jgi:hypothetical protein
MPYIQKKEREMILKDSKLDLSSIDNAGKLNYAITELMDHYLYIQGKNYQTFNDMIGALEGAKLELYRRKVSDFEDYKIKVNGDVYTEE